VRRGKEEECWETPRKEKRRFGSAVISLKSGHVHQAEPHSVALAANRNQ